MKTRRPDSLWSVVTECHPWFITPVLPTLKDYVGVSEDLSRSLSGYRRGLCLCEKSTYGIRDS